MCVRAICLLLAFFLSFRFYFVFFYFFFTFPLGLTCCRYTADAAVGFVRSVFRWCCCCYYVFAAFFLYVHSAAIVPYEIQMPTSCRLLALYFWFWFSEACANTVIWPVSVCVLGGNYECPAIVYKLMGLLVTVRIWFDVLLNLHQIVFARETRKKRDLIFSNWIYVANVCGHLCARALANWWSKRSTDGDEVSIN